MEKAHHDLKELLLKNKEKHRAEMARMMETMIRMSKGKDVASNPNLIEAAAETGTSREEPLYPPGFTPRHAHGLPEIGQQTGFAPPLIHAFQETGPLPAPPVGTYNYPGIPPPAGQAQGLGLALPILCWCQTLKSSANMRGKGMSSLYKLEMWKPNKDTTFWRKG